MPSPPLAAGLATLCEITWTADPEGLCRGHQSDHVMDKGTSSPGSQDGFLPPQQVSDPRGGHGCVTVSPCNQEGHRLG